MTSSPRQRKVHGDGTARGRDPSAQLDTRRPHYHHRHHHEHKPSTAATMPTPSDPSHPIPPAAPAPSFPTSPPPHPSPSPSVSTLPPAALALATRLFNAARTGQLDIFQQALPAGLPATLTNDKGDSLLMLAAYHSHAALVRLLLAHGADPNGLNDRGQSPLAGAVFKHAGAHGEAEAEAEVIEALLEGGADPEWGVPSAVEAVGMFQMGEVWRGRFEGARGRGRMVGRGEAEGREEGTAGRRDDGDGRIWRDDGAMGRKAGKDGKGTGFWDEDGA